ncbi:hypothetical protein SAMD00019534_086220 [Acytostelium subglobosum LB1]|uniref:hypothetical protein n=1 Tax=Acytostelium subglobosum LB1 TaxID=1410327 RepID=UPI0006448944|nr:hypothetical protein SAMD00019534_086220 [Acytostelium subglobosum LB1]GAM25447.1 hypothetical protein SAMD00019534_086220 [Acytostelium subglobosum LB1]|eukprot:XP_012751433.1 hypothetical protein SAMD00019534_086220 [Acytostelium subglobosum LB1]
MNILLPGLWFYNISVCLHKFLEGQGKINHCLIISAVFLVLDTLLTIFFVYGVGSFKGYGINGAAIANTISRGMLFFISLGYIMIAKFNCDVWNGWSKDCLSAKGVREYLGLAWPEVLEAFYLEMALVVIYTVSSWEYVSFNIALAVFQPLFGLSIALQDRISKNMQKSNIHKASRAAWVTIGFGFVYIIVAGGIILLATYFKVSTTQRYNYNTFLLNTNPYVLEASYGVMMMVEGVLRAVGRYKTGIIPSFIGIYVIALTFILSVVIIEGSYLFLFGVPIGFVSMSICVLLYLLIVNWKKFSINNQSSSSSSNV